MAKKSKNIQKVKNSRKRKSGKNVDKMSQISQKLFKIRGIDKKTRKKHRLKAQKGESDKLVLSYLVDAGVLFPAILSMLDQSLLENLGLLLQILLNSLKRTSNDSKDDLIGQSLRESSFFVELGVTLLNFVRDFGDIFEGFGGLGHVVPQLLHGLVQLGAQRTQLCVQFLG